MCTMGLGQSGEAWSHRRDSERYQAGLEQKWQHMILIPCGDDFPVQLN